ncbi:MAG: MATE family efflux transporter [Bacteroidota bacterium]
MNRVILKLAIPNILSNLAIPLLSSVDTALVGHLQGLEYLGAVAVGGMIFNFIYWGFGFLRMGTTGLTAQTLGENKHIESALVLGRALTIAGAIAVILLLFQVPIASLSMYLIKASPEVEVFARSYFFIRILAAPATLGIYAIQGWFLGMQNARFPLYLALVTNLSNILFSVIFVKIFRMHSDGVALGTVCAQYIGLLIALILLRWKYKSYLTNISIKPMLERSALTRFLFVNSDIFIRTICLVFVFSYFTAASAYFGDDILATNTILMQFWAILAYGIDGFAYAAESLVGMYVGAKNSLSLKKLIRYLFYWAGGLGFLFSSVFWLFDRPLLKIYTDKPDIIALALKYIWWTIPAPLVNGICFIWDGVFLGATDTTALRNSMIFCTFFIFIPCYFLLRDHWGNSALWFAMTLFMIARGVTLSIFAYYRISRWTAIK